jgi:hypothetical protein
LVGDEPWRIVEPLPPVEPPKDRDTRSSIGLVGILAPIGDESCELGAGLPAYVRTVPWPAPACE